MSVVASPIIPTDSDSAMRRPLVSPMDPITRPPIGRKRNATPKTASDASNAVAGEDSRKNTLPIVIAKKP